MVSLKLGVMRKIDGMVPDATSSSPSSILAKFFWRFIWVKQLNVVEVIDVSGSVALRHLESNANALYLLGMAALELGKPGEAVNLLNKSLWHSWTDVRHRATDMLILMWMTLLQFRMLGPDSLFWVQRLVVVGLVLYLINTSEGLGSRF